MPIRPWRLAGAPPPVGLAAPSPGPLWLTLLPVPYRVRRETHRRTSVHSDQGRWQPMDGQEREDRQRSAYRDLLKPLGEARLHPVRTAGLRAAQDRGNLPVGTDR